MKFTIAITAFNRKENLNKLIDDLLSINFSSEEVNLYISIDGGGSIYKSDFDDLKWDHGKLYIKEHDKNLGLKDHFFYIGNLSQKFGAIIFLEEDMRVSKFLESYVIDSINFYKNIEDVSVITLSNFEYDENSRTHFIPLVDGGDTIYTKLPYWGKIWIPSKWEHFMNWYINNKSNIDKLFKKLPSKIGLWPDSSFKKIFISYLIDENKYSVMPRFSLASNAALSGLHAKSMPQYQTPLLVDKRNWNFLKIEESMSVYDEYSEIIPDIVKQLNPSIKDYDFDVDIRGMKSYLKKEFILTTKYTKNSIKEFDISTRPPDYGVILNKEGKGIALSKREDVKKSYVWLKLAQLRNLHFDYETSIDSSFLRKISVLIYKIFFRI